MGDISSLTRCLERGDDVDTRRDLEVDNGPHLRDLTPLMVAARSIDGAGVETLRWLLEHGADLRAESEGGNTAVWYAAGKGGRWAFHEWRHCPDHVDRLRFLLDAGLDAHERNFIGRSLISEACDAGDPARVSLLISRGVRVGVSISTEEAEDRRDNDLWNHRAMLERMGYTPEQIEDDLTSHAASHPATTLPSSHEIPLFCAARSGSVECVRLVLNAGADINTSAVDGSTALFIAGSAEVARTLIAAGIRQNAQDDFGHDALSSILRGGCSAGACGIERFDVARVLIDAGADFNAIPRYPFSRLGDAAFSHNADAVDFLLSLGASVRPPPEAPTALHSICWQGEYADEGTNQACERIIRALVKAGIPVDASTDAGITPLHEAAAGDWGNHTAVRVLLELGASVDPRDSEGNTPLMLAAVHPDLEVVRRLIGAGANPLIRNAEGESAVDLARSHVETWESICRDAPEAAALPGDSPQAAQSRHREALDEARTSLRLIEEAAARSSSQ